MSYDKKLTLFISIIALGQGLLLPNTLWAGDYLNSAHGSSVKRTSPNIMNDYATGNCAHCHEMHASVVGAEPAPNSPSGPSPYTLFAENFNTAATTKSYGPTDNFCFYCHSGPPTASIQPTPNDDYSATFGGAASVTPYIMETFNQNLQGNQASYHNLSDIHNFIKGNSLFSWYTVDSNPCNGCHNPHLAKKNSTDPLSSAISKPSDHFNLWGETQLMSSYGAYQEPYSNIPPGATYEPNDTINEPLVSGSTTPDYVTFCLDCHNNLATTDITSTTIYVDGVSVGKKLSKIDWSSGGDIHGGSASGGDIDGLPPYNTTTNNLTLSCLDCHEPHGSPNIMLLRRRVNGDDIATITDTGVIMGMLCRQCHEDDDAAKKGTGKINSWEYAHHISTGHPYNEVSCGQCHGSGGNPPPKIPCGKCHMHGMTDQAPVQNTGLKTF